MEPCTLIIAQCVIAAQYIGVPELDTDHAAEKLLISVDLYGDITKSTDLCYVLLLLHRIVPPARYPAFSANRGANACLPLWPYARLRDATSSCCAHRLSPSPCLASNLLANCCRLDVAVPRMRIVDLVIL